MTTPQYGVQYAPLSQEIHAGEVSEDGKYFTAKSIATDGAIKAVAELVKNKYDGFVLMTDATTEVTITVKPRNPQGDQT